MAAFFDLHRILMQGTSRMYAGSIQQMHSGYAGRLLSQTFAPSKDALGQREDPLEPPEQPPEWVTNAPGQFGIRAHSCTTSNLSKASFSSALGSAGIRDSTAFEDGQLRDSLGSESGHRDDSVVSGAIQLRDSIAGLLQSEQSASQHSTTSGSTTAKGAAQFSGFGTSVEQITSPGLVDSAVTNPLSYSRQAEPVQLTPWPPVRLHHAEDLQHPHGQFTSSSSSSIRQTDRLQAAEVQSDALDTGRASIARPQQDSWSATGPEQENRQASAHLKELCSPADGNSLFQQPGQLQAPSALQRGDSQLSGAASQPVSESPAASTSRFKQVGLASH